METLLAGFLPCFCFFFFNSYFYFIFLTTDFWDNMQLCFTIKLFNDWETLVGARTKNILKNSSQSYDFFWILFL